jgi:hypothetical protein
LTIEPHLKRIRDGNYLHNARLDQFLDPLTDGRFGQIDSATNIGIRFAAVNLELFHNRARHIVECRRTRVSGHELILTVKQTKIK